MLPRTATIRLLCLTLALLFAAGCGDGSSGGSTPAPVPATCSDAFGEDAAATQQAASEPVGLSTCDRGAGGSVAIGGSGCGPRVVVDKNFTGADALGRITIADGGALAFPDLDDPELDTPKTLTLETAGIRIEKGGRLSVGTAACPIGYHPAAEATIVFTGDRDPSCTPARGCDDGSVKGIEVRPGATLSLVGAKGVPDPHPEAGPPGVSWTALRESVEPGKGGATLRLAADVTQGQRPWEAGDWIVVATSSFSPFESEFVQIEGAPKPDGEGGSIVRTRQGMKYFHFGSLPPTPSQRCTVDGGEQQVACGSLPDCAAPCESVPSPLNYHDPAERNFGIDERAQVGLISRSVRLTAKLPEAPPPDRTPLDPDPSLHWGGEIRIAGNHDGTDVPDVTIVGVELEKFGKDQLGSYPIHLHHLGRTGGKLQIAANSVHHSFNKCVTMHMSSDLTLADNVCARIVGHIFYQEHGSEENVAFHRNLGIGAMSNSFDINRVTTLPPTPRDIPRSALIRDYWWTGDHLAASAGFHYDGFNIPNTDDQTNPTHGSCKEPISTGSFGAVSEVPCKPGTLYTEPASGFWIVNPSAELIGNSIAGCQGVGRAYWWVPPTKPIEVNGVLRDLKFQPIGIPGRPHAFLDNRASACYAGFYGEPDHGVISEQLLAHKDGTPSGQPVITSLTGMTATRNRFRGVWLRPTWFVLSQGRFATNRESVSLVTSGGLDGNAPGVWLLLEDSVLAGVSRNNVDRFGPCPRDLELGVFTGGQFGCIDRTPPPPGVPAHSADDLGEGYPPPSWNMFGYMLYDGPVRVFNDRFVNFLKDPSPLLTAKDNAFLKEISSRNTPVAQVCATGPRTGQHCSQDADCCASGESCPGSCPLPNVLCSDIAVPNCCAQAQGCNVHFVYEGDAALGWFQSNQSAYPTATVSRGLSFENTDLRHQIYTEKVSLNFLFNDGDKNTAIIDEDGTLTGFGVKVRDPRQVGEGKVVPISLNNLPFNATSNAVDECLSTGAQNAAFEGRDTSLISAGSMGTLEFSTLYPWREQTPEGTPIPFPGPSGDNTHTQFITFTRDDPQRDASGNPRRDEKGNIVHSTMKLHSRDGRGVWEPKLTSGFGYTTAASPAPDFPASTGKAGIAPIITVGMVDIVKPDISPDNPFFVRLGICYSDADGNPPQDPSRFRITRGYKSFIGSSVNPTDPELLKYWSPSDCNNLDSLNPANITTPTCPGPRPRSVARPPGGACPSGSAASGDRCVFPTSVLERVDDIAAMTNANGTPDLERYFYDKNSGMLFLWVAQDEPNPIGPSPLGSCTGDPATDPPACPDVHDGESYYACPKDGCHLYLIELDDPSYTPGASTCQPYPTYTRDQPFHVQNELVLYGTDTVVQPVLGFDKSGEPFHTASAATDPQCKLTTATTSSSLLPAAVNGAPMVEDAGSAAPVAADGGRPTSGVDAASDDAGATGDPIAGETDDDRHPAGIFVPTPTPIP